MIFGWLRSGVFGEKYWLAVSLIMIILAYLVNRQLFWPVIFMAGVILAGNRMAAHLQQNLAVSRLVGQEVVVRGCLSEDVDKSESGQLSIRVDIVSIDDRQESGRIYLTSSSLENPPRRSDEIVFRTKLTDGFGNFAATGWRVKITEIVRRADFMRDLRDDFSDKVRQFLPSPEVDLGMGYLLGQKNSLPVGLEEALRITALTHIVVASGYNLTILVRFARRFLAPLSKLLALLASGILIVSFVVMVGFSPSMVRAGIVAGLSLLAWFFGRQFRPGFLLALVATITLMINPGNIYDLGWQLSFGSFFGVMILAPILKRFFIGPVDKPSMLGQVFFETISAQIATLPMIVYMFGIASIVSIAANLVVLPLVPLSMLATFLTGLFGYLLPILAPLFGLLAHLLLGFSIGAISFFASIPGAQVELEVSLSVVLIAYGILALGCLVAYRKYSPSKDLSTNPVS